jgi:hypothetical protein
MIGGNFGAAQLTAFYIFPAPDELAERPKCILVSRLDCAHNPLHP